MKVKWDLHELTDFADGLKNVYNLETTLMTITQNIARELHKIILNKTPIDTGNLRKMWSAGDNLLFTVNRIGDTYEVILLNKATNGKDGFMYGVAVNDGHRTSTGGWVVGRFFVDNSVLQLENSSKLTKIVYQELLKWYERL